MAAGKFESSQIKEQIVALMQQYNVVFYNPAKKQYIAPQYLPEVPTVHYSQVKRLLVKPQFIIKVEGFLPKPVVNNIIARYAVKDDAANFYKYGVKTETEGIILLIEVDYQARKIYVYTDAPGALQWRNFFEDILLEFGLNLKAGNQAFAADKMPGAKSDQETSLRGKEQERQMEEQVKVSSDYKVYLSVDDKIFVDWALLWNTYRTPDKNMEREYCIAEDGNMVLLKMFAPYYLPYHEIRNLGLAEQAKPKKLFISYSSRNTDFMRRLVTHLEPLKRNGTVELWHDRMIKPGTKWDDSIKEEMRKADLILFLLSPDFIAINYIFEFEIPQAIRQMESENSKLLFVELQPCSWDKTVLSRFQQTTNPTADNKGVITVSEALNDGQWKKVVDELEKKLAKS